MYLIRRERERKRKRERERKRPLPIYKSLSILELSHNIFMYINGRVQKRNRDHYFTIFQLLLFFPSQRTHLYIINLLHEITLSHRAPTA